MPSEVIDLVSDECESEVEVQCSNRKKRNKQKNERKKRKRKLENLCPSLAENLYQVTSNSISAELSDVKLDITSIETEANELAFGANHGDSRAECYNENLTVDCNTVINYSCDPDLQCLYKSKSHSELPVKSISTVEMITQLLPSIDAVLQIHCRAAAVLGPRRELACKEGKRFVVPVNLTWDDSNQRVWLVEAYTNYQSYILVGLKPVTQDQFPLLFFLQGTQQDGYVYGQHCYSSDKFESWCYHSLLLHLNSVAIICGISFTLGSARALLSDKLGERIVWIKMHETDLPLAVPEQAIQKIKTALLSAKESTLIIIEDCNDGLWSHGKLIKTVLQCNVYVRNIAWFIDDHLLLENEEALLEMQRVQQLKNQGTFVGPSLILSLPKLQTWIHSLRATFFTPKQIYCDLDGVLTNFVKKVIEVCGKDPEQCDADQMWTQLEAVESGKPNGFYAQLDWMPGGIQLWEYIRELKPIILSGVPRGTWAGPQKRQWCARQLGKDVPVSICFAAAKAKLCKPGDVLIDDKVELEQAWRNRGGIFIQHTSTENTIQRLQMLGIFNGVRHTLETWEDDFILKLATY